jgi:hypothetical protein
MMGCEMELEIEYDLEFNDEKYSNRFSVETINSSEDEESSENDLPSTSYQLTKNSNSKNFPGLKYKTKTIAFWKGGKKRKSFQNVQHKFRYVKNINMLYDWNKQIEENGSRNDKLLKIHNHTLNKFKKAKKLSLIVHDIDLKRWAINFNKKIDVKDFKASNNWVWKFKQKNRIISRKITKLITSKHNNENTKSQEMAKDFVEKVKPLIINHGPQSIYNTDQSGFNYEIHSGRTLEIKGTKHVEAKFQSISSSTHSYTIQPTISADGKLLNTLLVVLQENDNKFGPVVQKNIFKAPNICVIPSKSGKLNKEHLITWFKDVFFTNSGQQSVLLVDSWTTYKDTKAINNIKPNEHEFKMLTIPAHTTHLVQPLDVYCFRFWKNFVRRFSDRVLLDDMDINLHQRNNIIKLQSLIHNQFSSPRFYNCFKYAWFKSGYTEIRPGPFKNPVEFCFVITDKNCDKCDDINFIFCAWCKLSFCFNHFFINYHFCDVFID